MTTQLKATDVIAEAIATGERTDELLRLHRRRTAVVGELGIARRKYLEARARKNHLQAQLDTIDDQINSIQQGQLLLCEGGEQ